MPAVTEAGALNLYGAFWRQVIADVQGLRVPPRGRRVHRTLAETITRANTLAWLLDDALTYDPMGLPISFRAWCRFGGMDLDPEWWRAAILSGEAPAAFQYEDE